jgi:hypothetical protein
MTATALCLVGTALGFGMMGQTDTPIIEVNYRVGIAHPHFSDCSREFKTLSRLEWL